jgi:hypothetical protein
MKEDTISIADPTLGDRIKGRKSAFLDTHFWNKVAREKNELPRHMKKSLRSLVQCGKIFCPLSQDVLDELFKQNYESALCVAELMNELSLNACFANNREIYNKEVLNHLMRIIDGKEYNISNTDLFVSISAHVRSEGKLVYPNGFPQDRVKECSELIAEKLSKMTLVDLVEFRKDTLPIKPEVDLSCYSEIWRERRDFTKGNRNKMHRIEEEYVSRSLILPRLNRYRAWFPIYLQEKYLRHIHSVPKDNYSGALGHILKELPSLNNFVEVMTVAGLDPNKKPCINDYHDMEMMIVPLTYSDVFVSEDKWIRRLISQLSDPSNKTRATYIDSFASLEKYLESIRLESLHQ